MDLSYKEDLLLLATATVKSVESCHTITELVVVWSVWSVCTSVTKSTAHIQNLLYTYFPSCCKSRKNLCTYN